MVRVSSWLASILILILAPGTAAQETPQQKGPELLVQCDDAGFSHGSNVALDRLIGTGLRINASILFAGPWYQETVSILADHPEVCVGVHLCATSEWDNFKWGPVAGRNRVPGLVDSEGFFLPTRAELDARDPSLDAFRREFQAQIDRARKTGLKIDYIDVHMGVALSTQAQREMLTALAKTNHVLFAWDQDVALMDGFWERHQIGPFERQQTRLLELMHALDSKRPTVAIFHIGTDTPELRAMYDGRDGWPVMAKQRQLELDLLLSDRFRQTVVERNIRLIQYRDLTK